MFVSYVLFNRSFGLSTATEHRDNVKRELSEHDELVAMLNVVAMLTEYLCCNKEQNYLLYTKYKSWNYVNY